MILDHFLIPLLSVIYAALTAQRMLPSVPYFAWALLFTVGITAINVRGIRVTAKASTAMMFVMSVCALLFICLAGHLVVVAHGPAGLLSPAGLIRHLSTQCSLANILKRISI